MKYMAIIDADEKPVSCEFIGCNGNAAPYLIGATTNIKAIEQEAKAVLYSGDGYADGYMVYDMAKCPNCGYEYEESDKDWKLPFCPNCGQSLNWESEDKE